MVANVDEDDLRSYLIWRSASEERDAEEEPTTREGTDVLTARADERLRENLCSMVDWDPSLGAHRKKQYAMQALYGLPRYSY